MTSESNDDITTITKEEDPVHGLELGGGYEEDEDLFNADEDETGKQKEDQEADIPLPDPNSGEPPAPSVEEGIEDPPSSEPQPEKDEVNPPPSEPQPEYIAPPSLDVPPLEPGNAALPDPEAKNEETTAQTKAESILNMRIPRISTSNSDPSPSPPPAAAAATTTTRPPVKQGVSGSKYGLPPEILVPLTITPNILNGRLLDSLRGLPNLLIIDALAEFDDACQIKGDTIRNPGAYLWGVVKRYMSVQERQLAGAEGGETLHMGPDLTPAVIARLEKLVTDKFCTETEMNDKVKSKIGMLSEIDALYAIEELASVDRAQIRNFGSYFMGILNRYMRGERLDVTSGKKTLAEVRQQFFQNQSPHGNRANDRKRGRENEFPFGRGGREDLNHRPPLGHPNQRDRNDMGPGRRDFDPYGPPNPSPYGPAGGGPGGPPMINQSPRMQGGGPVGGGPPNRFQQPPPSVPYGPNPYGPSQGGPPSHQGPPSQQHYGPSSMGGPPNPYGNQPPNAGFGQPPANQFGQPPNFAPQNPYGNPQQQPGGVPGMAPPSNSFGMPQNQPAFMGQQQHQQQQPSQSFSNPPYPSPSNQQNPYSPQGGPPPNQWGAQASTQSPSAPLDIMALADKASSAVQALQNLNKAQGGLPPQMQYQQQQPPPFQQQPPPFGGPLGTMNIPPSFPPGGNPPPGFPPMQQPYAGVNLQTIKKRRTTASILDLPINVQFAVQNLQATGQTGALDDGMLGMIKDLPEETALHGLQKFAALDKSNMRNPTAYLAGLLRRELEKIHRR